jgi:hypothetical protein
MTNPLFMTAAVVTLVTFCVHFFIGGKVVAAPLLADRSLPPASKWLNYLCWHIASVALALAAAGFAYAAFDPQAQALAVFLTVQSFAMSLLSAVVARRGRINPFRFPSTSLLAVIGMLGAAGLLA